MKIVAFLLSALLFSGTAISDSYRQVLRYTPHASVRVVQSLPQQLRRVLPAPAHRARVAVIYLLPRPAHRHVAVVTYRPHFRPVVPLVYGQPHRHHVHCRH